MPYRSLKGKAAIVTGGGRGIGRAIATGYAHEGARILVFARTRDDVEATAVKIAASGGSCVPFVGDVRSQADAESAVNKALDEFGGVDVLVNNAGIDGSMESFQKLTRHDIEETLETNLYGPFNFSKAVLPHMVAKGRGNIINITSGAGARVPGRKVRSIPYTVSKFGMEGLSYALASSLDGTGINVNALNPGPTRTSFQSSWTEAQLNAVAGALGKFNSPEDIIPAAVYLATLMPGELSGESISANQWNRNPKA